MVKKFKIDFDWKEFLKPNLSKVILSLIIFLILPIKINASNSPQLDIGIITQPVYRPLIVFILDILSLIQDIGLVALIGFIEVDMLFLLLSLVISYGLSCLLPLSYFYRKYKK